MGRVPDVLQVRGHAGEAAVVGRDRGQLVGAADIDLAIDQLAGPIYYRVLVTRQSVGPEFIDALVERYLAGSRDR